MFLLDVNTDICSSRATRRYIRFERILHTLVGIGPVLSCSYLDQHIIFCCDGARQRRVDGRSIVIGSDKSVDPAGKHRILELLITLVPLDDKDEDIGWELKYGR